LLLVRSGAPRADTVSSLPFSKTILSALKIIITILSFQNLLLKMSKHLKKIKNPFQCKDCKTFCTSSPRLLQVQRENTCAYFKRRRELLEKNYNLINGRKRQSASASSPTIDNSRIIPTTLVSPIDFATTANNSSISSEMRYMNNENDGIGNSYDQPDDCMDSPIFDTSPPHFHPEDNDLTCHQNQYRKWQEKVSELLYNKGNTSYSRTPNSNNSSNQNSFHGLARYLKLGWTYDINMEKKEANQILLFFGNCLLIPKQIGYRLVEEMVYYYLSEILLLVIQRKRTFFI